MKKNNTSYPQPHCPKCNSSLRLISGENDWFCDRCNIFPKTSKELSSSNINKGSVRGNQKFWIISLVILLLIVILYSYQSIFLNVPFFEPYTFFVVIFFIIAYFAGLFFTKIMLNKKR